MYGGLRENIPFANCA